MVAKGLNNIALRLQLISSLHFGVIARRSIVDAAGTLTYNIEKSFRKQKILSALAFDIKATFDEVIDYRLSQRLLDLKILLPLIQYLSSFLNDQTAAIRFDGGTGDQERLKIGVSQSFPVALILFMLFTAPLFKLFLGINRVTSLTI